MGDGSNIKLVQCPNCVNLLPELPGKPLFQCGACGTVLRGSTKGAAADARSFEKGGNVGYVSDRENYAVDSDMRNNNMSSEAGDMINNRSSPRRENYYDSVGMHRRNQSLGLRQPAVENSSTRKTYHASFNYRPSREPMAMVNWVGEDDENMSVHSYESVNKPFRVERGNRAAIGSQQLNDYDQPYMRSRDRGDSRWDMDQGRISNSRYGYPEEGPSDYRRTAPSYSHTRSMRSQWNVPDRMGSSELDKAELLRKVQELNRHIRNSGETMPSEPRQMFPGNRRMSSNDSYNARAGFPDRYENEMPGNGREQVWRPTMRRSVNEYRQQPYNSHLEDYGDFHQDPFPVRSQDSVFQHQMGSRRTPEGSSDLRLRVSPRPFSPRDQVPPGRWSNNSDVDYDGLRPSRPRNGLALALPKKHRKSCHPVAGASPFVMCSNCSILIILPRRLRTIEKKHEVRCGSCSVIMSVEVDGKKLITSIVMMRDSCEDIKEKCKALIPSAISFDGHGYRGNQSPWRHPEENVLSEEKQNNVHRYEVKPRPDSSFSSLRKVEEEEEEELGSKGSLISKRESVVSAELRLKDQPFPTLPIPALQNDFDDGPPNIVHESQNEKEIGDSAAIQQEPSCLQESASNYGSNRDNPTPTTELEVPHHEYPITGLSQDSVDVNKEEDQRQRRQEGNRTFFVGIPDPERNMREQQMPIVNESSEHQRPYRSLENQKPYQSLENQKPYQSLDNQRPYQSFDNQEPYQGLDNQKTYQSLDNQRPYQSLDNEKPYQSLDDQRPYQSLDDQRPYQSLDNQKPYQSLDDQRPKVTVNGHEIPDYAVWKAERVAGPILPGNYWYDYHAGFWGVMNTPCLGIIPPHIEEFNYQIPQGCAAGNTGVFVNGRELHQRDLDLLASRGLPTTRYKSYSIHISGKVLDEKTGAELYDLGKLAPSVENAGRGFGMRIPSPRA